MKPLRVTTAPFFIGSRRPFSRLIKTLESFRWDWPKKINQLQIQDLFRLRFIDEKANHPDRPSSKYYYEIYIEEDLLERARRERI